MNEDNEQLVLMINNAFGEKRNEYDDNIWNIFVQILLPKVMLLSIIALIAFMTYKTIADNERENANELRQEIEKVLEKVDPKKERIKAQYSLIELQFQKLLNALQKVGQHVRSHEFHLFFSNAHSIQLNGKKVVDPNFKILCQNSKTIFDHRRRCQKFKNTIYKKILKQSGIKDRTRRGVYVRFSAKIPDDSRYIHSIKLNIITPGNRVKIHNHIVEYVSQLKSEIVKLQDGLLNLLFEKTVNNPFDFELDRKSKQLLTKRQNKNINEQDRIRYGKELRLSLIDRWKALLKQDGYDLLNINWYTIKSD